MFKGRWGSCLFYIVIILATIIAAYIPVYRYNVRSRQISQLMRQKDSAPQKLRIGITNNLGNGLLYVVGGDNLEIITKSTESQILDSLEAGEINLAVVSVEQFANKIPFYSNKSKEFACKLCGTLYSCDNKQIVATNKTNLPKNCRMLYTQGTSSAYATLQYIDENSNFFTKHNTTLIPVNSDKEALQLLKNSQADIAVVNEENLKKFADKNINKLPLSLKNSQNIYILVATAESFKDSKTSQNIDSLLSNWYKNTTSLKKSNQGGGLLLKNIASHANQDQSALNDAISSEQLIFFDRDDVERFNRNNFIKLQLHNALEIWSLGQIKPFPFDKKISSDNIETYLEEFIKNNSKDTPHAVKTHKPEKKVPDNEELIEERVPAPEGPPPDEVISSTTENGIEVKQ
ncbi:hypothetical protein IJT10_04290 [bacterium]|nr:hypothetical protein [bacterium]